MILVFMLPGCEEEVPDYAGDILGIYIAESVTYMGETIDLTDQPIEASLIVEITRSQLIAYENDDDYCEDTYTVSSDEIDGVTESAILFTDESATEYRIEDGKLIFDEDGDLLVFGFYSGTVPPASWTDPSQLTNDTYEPDNEQAFATTIAAGGTVQNHYLASCGDLDFFMFSAINGKTYTLETSTLDESLDLVLYLYSAGGDYITDDDDSGLNYNPSLSWTCEASGDYYFLVVGFSYEDMGNYSVSVVESQGLLIATPKNISKEKVGQDRIRPGDLFFN